MAKVARYTLDDGTQVAFEYEPPAGYAPASSEEAVEKVRAAVQPAVDAARVVIEQVRRAAPDEAEVSFGIKVSGQANWFIAKAATEANFEVRLAWKKPAAEADGGGAGGDQP